LVANRGSDDCTMRQTPSCAEAQLTAKAQWSPGEIRTSLRRRLGMEGRGNVLLDINDKVLLFLSVRSGRLEEEGTLQIWILLAYLA
jgi:hypothetical protein